MHFVIDDHHVQSCVQSADASDDDMHAGLQVAIAAPSHLEAGLLRPIQGALHGMKHVELLPLPPVGTRATARPPLEPLELQLSRLPLLPRPAAPQGFQPVFKFFVLLHAPTKFQFACQLS